MKKGVRGLLYSLVLAIIAIAYFGANIIVSDANDRIQTELDKDNSITINYKGNSSKIFINYKIDNGDWVNKTGFQMEKSKTEESEFVYTINNVNGKNIIAYFYNEFGYSDTNNGTYYLFTKNINYCDGKL